MNPLERRSPQAEQELGTEPEATQIFFLLRSLFYFPPPSEISFGCRFVNNKEKSI